MAELVVRPATAADIPAMSTVLTASITDLCGADHDNDPAAIAAWTANKTIAGVSAMLANPDLAIYVAERDGAVVAVGAVNTKGEIGLNYVAPWARFSGASKALMARMEAALLAAGHSEARLNSTATALRFYRSAGWEQSGPPDARSYPMHKRLEP